MFACLQDMAALPWWEAETGGGGDGVSGRHINGGSMGAGGAGDQPL